MDEKELTEFLKSMVQDGIMSAEDAENIVYRYMNEGVPLAQLRDEWRQGATEALGFDPTAIQSENTFELQRALGTPNTAMSETLGDIVEDELTHREEIANQGFLEYLANPSNYGRLVASALKGPPQIANAMTNLLPGLVAQGAGAATGNEGWTASGQVALERAHVWNESINRFFGTPDPLHPAESIAEAGFSAAVPGGAGIRLASFGADFTTDQMVRQLVGQDVEQYQTIFDRVGLGHRPEMSPWYALPISVAAGTTATSVALRQSRHFKTGAYSTAQENPSSIQISDWDANAPQNLESITTTGDLARVQMIDEIEALSGIVERAGIPDPVRMNERLSFDTHAALRSRVAEGIKLGRFSHSGSTFAPRYSPEVLRNASRRLDPETRQAVNNYIHLRDVQDDLRINIREALDAIKDASSSGDVITKARASLVEMRRQIAQVGRQAKQYEQQFPIAREFHANYRSVTNSVRDFLEGNLFTPEFRTQLDQTRPNYVPLQFSAVDRNAPFWKRMTQAGERNIGDVEKPWFLHQREVDQMYDISRRVDPFDMLMEYTTSALHAGVTNDVRRTVIDELAHSRFGSGTVRRAEEGEALRFPNHAVSIYRDGVEEVWMTERLTADLLRFDPIVAKHPIMYSIKRLSELSLTGPASVSFAGTSSFRDSLTGAAFREAGVQVGGPLHVASAVPEQVLERGRLAFANSIREKVLSNTYDLADVFTTREAQVQFADTLTDQFSTSAYHYMQSMGGYDASIARSRINAGTSQLKELRRTLLENPIMQSSFVNNVGTRNAVRTMSNILDSFITLYGSVMDAPRFAAIKRSIEAGEITPQQAVLRGSRIASDVRRTGRTYRSDGEKIRADVVNPNIAYWGLDTVGGPAAQAYREFVPFANPAVQGARLQFNRMLEDPVGTNARLWLYTGMPTMLAYMWNESLGPEYADYSVYGRSTYDFVMNNYLGHPALPPEQGLELPRGHETVLWGAPYAFTFHALSQGEDRQFVRMAMSDLLGTITANSTPLAYPTTLSIAENMVGWSTPDHLFTGEGRFQPRESDQAVLPNNLEMAFRNNFGLVGSTAVEVLHALGANEDDPPLSVALEAAWEQFERRTPVLRNRNKARSGWFSIPAQVNMRRAEQMNEFWELWDEFYNPDKQYDADEEGMLRSWGAQSRNLPSLDNNIVSDRTAEDDLPDVRMGPSLRPKPTNPVYEEFGELLIDNLRRSGMSMTGFQRRASQINHQVRLLNNYNAGNASAIREWQEYLGGQHEEVDRLKEFLEDHDIDLSEFSDRRRLINLLEIERSDLVRSQLDVFEQTEAQVTEMLRAQGLLGPDEKFEMDRHLKPYENPFQSRVPQ